jgi:probable HAF family extracellular repeat protein
VRYELRALIALVVITQSACAADPDPLSETMPATVPGTLPSGRITNAGLTTINLGTLPGGGWSAAYAINQQGTITGYAQDAAGGPHLVRWKRGGSIEDLGQIGGASTFGLGIDDAEEIVGASGAFEFLSYRFPNSPAVGAERAFYWNGATGFQILPGNGPSRANGVQRINNNTRTRIVGCDAGRVAVWTGNGAGFTLSHPALPASWKSDSSCATALNPRGLYVGAEGTPSTFIAGYDDFHPFASLQSSGYSLLPDQGGNTLSAAYGQAETPRRIVGLWRNRAVLWPTASAALIPLVSNPTVHDYSVAYGVNNLTQIVGRIVSGTNQVDGAFFWTSDIGLVQLPSVATNGIGGSAAYALNDTAEVVGSSANDAGGHSATLWLPHDTAQVIIVKQLPGTTTHLPPVVAYLPRRFINDGILSRPGFDATRIDPNTVTISDGFGHVTPISQRLRPPGPPTFQLRDLNGDGVLDMQVQFSTTDMIASGTLSRQSFQFVVSWVDATGLPGSGKYPIRVR